VAIQGAQVEPIHADLVAAAMKHRTPDRALLARAAAGRAAVSFGADPALTLALVVWPSEKVMAAQRTGARNESAEPLNLPPRKTEGCEDFAL
jgi:hypothetical protein